ncbi:MAG: hypothetical protein WA110_04350 [Anaerolineaceae bacterium]
MNATAVQKVCKEVYVKYPKLAGKKPRVTEQGTGKFLLVFSHKDEIAAGKTLEQTVRVVADEAGNISKISSSRG